MMWSMVSIGGTPFFGNLWTQTIGDRKMTQVDTEREDGDKNKVDDYDESKVYEEIKQKFGVDVVRLKRNSDGMMLVQSDIDESLKRVCLIYSNEETIIEYQMVFNYKEQSHGYDVEDKKIKEEQIEVDGNKIDIIQYELSDGSEENIAQFKYEDVFYILNTTMKEEEFKKILKNLFHKKILYYILPFILYFQQIFSFNLEAGCKFYSITHRYCINIPCSINIIIKHVRLNIQNTR